MVADSKVREGKRSKSEAEKEFFGEVTGRKMDCLFRGEEIEERRAGRKCRGVLRLGVREGGARKSALQLLFSSARQCVLCAAFGLAFGFGSGAFPSRTKGAQKARKRQPKSICVRRGGRRGAKKKKKKSGAVFCAEQRAARAGAGVVRGVQARRRGPGRQGGQLGGRGCFGSGLGRSRKRGSGATGGEQQREGGVQGERAEEPQRHGGGSGGAEERGRRAEHQVDSA